MMKITGGADVSHRRVACATPNFDLTKKGIMKAAAIFSTLLVLFSGALQAQNVFSVKTFKMTVAGTSSAHDWESDVTKLTAEGKMTITGGSLEKLQSLQVTVPAKSIVSTKGKIMDNKTYEALKADEYPNISFQLSEIEGISPSGGSFNVKAKGNLTIAGVKKPVSMSVTATVAANGQVTFKGSKKINMVDFGMEPPKALGGMIKVGPEVTIGFELTMAPAAL
jgi:polyisoprenoid-binding protein YceI